MKTWLLKETGTGRTGAYKYTSYYVFIGTRPKRTRLKVTDKTAQKVLAEMSLASGYDPKTHIYQSWDNGGSRLLVCGNMMEKVFPKLKKMRANSCKQVELDLKII